MSDQNLHQYQLDITGINPDNKIVDESHSLIRQRNRALSLNHGAFYTETLEIKHVDTGYVLQKYIDYKILQPYSTLITLTGQSVAGIILIHNSNIHQNLAISYQAVGGEFAINSKSLEAYLNSISDQGTTFSWYNSLLSDQSFEGTSPQLDVFDFHWLSFTLEKIRNAILWSDSQYYDKIRKYLDDVMNSIEVQTKLSLDYYLSEQFENFRSSVNKLSLGLGNLNNIGTASSLESIEIAKKDSRINQFEFNKYITLQNLAVFKETLYDKFALSSNTNIGLNRGVALAPTIVTLLDMLNGSIFILRSRLEFADENKVYESNIYPPNSTLSDSYSILKIINNPTNRGGLYLYSERSGKDIYLAGHSTGNPITPLEFNKIITEDDTGIISQDISEHLVDINNPHKDTKESVGFKKLVNKSVVTREEILSLQSCSKYVTMDTLLLFAKTYMVNQSAAAQDPRNDDRDHVQIIYTAQAEDKCLPPECPCPDVSPPAVIVSAAPLLVKLKQYINNTLKNPPPNNLNIHWNDYFDKTNESFPDYSIYGEYGYSDGNNGYTNKFNQIIKNNSICAGYSEDQISIDLNIPYRQTLRGPGVTGATVEKAIVFTPSLSFNSINTPAIDEYGVTEYVAFIKPPGRKPHYIRGIMNDGVACNLPNEFFGTNTHHTGSQYISVESTYFAMVKPFNEYEIKLYDENDSDLYMDGDSSIVVVRNNGNVNYYSDEPVSVYVTLQTHKPTGVLSGTCVVYNVHMELDDYSQEVLLNDPISATFITLNNFNSYNSVQGEIPGFSFYAPNNSVVNIDTINNLGMGAYSFDFDIDISSLDPGKTVIYLEVIVGGDRVGLSHFMQIDVQLPIDVNFKTIPVFENNVATGTIGINLNSNGTLSMGPFNGRLDITPDILSNVYFFEKTVINGENPFVFVNDVYSDETELIKNKNYDVNNFIISNFINVTETTNYFYDYSSLSVYNSLAKTLESFKKHCLETDRNQYSKYTSVKTLTLDEYNSITKVRMVPFRDPDYVCTLFPIMPTPEPPTEA